MTTRIRSQEASPTTIVRQMRIHAAIVIRHDVERKTWMELAAGVDVAQE